MYTLFDFHFFSKKGVDVHTYLVLEEITAEIYKHSINEFILNGQLTYNKLDCDFNYVDAQISTKTLSLSDLQKFLAFHSIADFDFANELLSQLNIEEINHLITLSSTIVNDLTPLILVVDKSSLSVEELNNLKADLISTTDTLNINAQFI